MDMRHVRILPPVGAPGEPVITGSDLPVEDDVIRARMLYRGSHEGTRHYACCRHVQGMDAAESIWVVIGDLVLMGGVPQPSVRGVLSVGPAGIYLTAQCAECAHEPGPMGPADEE